MYDIQTHIQHSNTHMHSLQTDKSIKTVIIKKINKNKNRNNKKEMNDTLVMVKQRENNANTKYINAIILWKKNSLHFWFYVVLFQKGVCMHKTNWKTTMD